jgi:Recombinase zinc beta ribbon domain/Recombinase
MVFYVPCLKGTMSEVELFTMRNRLERGRLFKAERGELFNDLPFGFVKLPNGQVVQEPDEQARAVVQLLFDKFDELGTVYGVFRYLLRHGIRLGMRERIGPQRGQLVWRKPSVPVLLQTYRHPFYAGAYAYGRRTVDRKRRAVAGGRTGQGWRPMTEWKVLKRDRLPAYITWERYLANMARINDNRPRAKSPGVARTGCALLSGLLVCGKCGRRMQPQYKHQNAPYYICLQGYQSGDANTCCGFAGRQLDELVAKQVLLALEPASIDLSVQAGQAIHVERQRLHKHWQRQLERAQFDANRAQRQYHAVEPENRLVARSLEKNWEDALRHLRELEVEYDRFKNSQPATLTADEQRRIESLATDIPAVWRADTTTNVDRKEICRCLIERILVHAAKDHELVDVTICWRGGVTSQHQILRPIGRYDLQRDYKSLMQRITELRLAGSDTLGIARQLAADGYRPPSRANKFTEQMIRNLLLRTGVGDDRNHPGALKLDEWWVPDLARHLNMCAHKLRKWAERGWLSSRKTPIQRLWVLWADSHEVDRLRQLLDHSKRGVNNYPPELTTPNPGRTSAPGLRQDQGAAL